MLWLRDASERMGGHGLRRRQLNVLWWNGAATEAEAAAAAAKGDAKARRDASAAALARDPIAARAAAEAAGAAAYKGYGTWRAATIRGYDPKTCRFEVK